MPVDGVFNIYGQKYNSTSDLRVNTEGVKPTFCVAATSLSLAATPTDVVTIYGSSTKTVKIKRITVQGLAGTTAGTMRVKLVKRTAANTGGTYTTATPAQFDSADAAATATVSVYSANATSLGTGVNIGTGVLNFGLTGAAGAQVFDFSTRNDKPIVLNGATQGIAINLNSDAVPAGTTTFGYSIEWEEV